MKLRNAPENIVFITKQDIGLWDTQSKTDKWVILTRTEQSLSESFQEISEKLSSTRLKILIGAELAVTRVITVSIANEKHVFAEAQKLVDFEIAKDCFDFRVVERTDKGYHIQIFVIPETLLNDISAALHKAHLNVDTILPAAAVIAQTTKEEESPHLILYDELDRIVILTSGGVVYASLFSPEGLTDAIQGQIAGVAKEFEFSLNVAYISENSEIFQLGEGWSAQALKVNIIEILSSKRMNRIKVFSHKTIMIFLIIGLCVYFVAQQGNQFIEEVGQTTATPVPSPTEEPIHTENYKVEVLNGSGESGAAAEVVEALSSIEFEKVLAGNANEYGHTDTEVSIKEGLPEGLFITISDVLSEYTVVKGALLSLDYEYDVRIITGTAE
ncbi:hypothetical protein A2801_00480 [Candidatus Woesebacteria bacterium RIFCSPHIGHO2_01_FULL_41_10]|uniref:LytR/CpsA/Psr regulator C-terminal domain-containing protein n=1 Tax=Candidatus Woesebacteria bacterium RIFCSPHIGHO2_01_FULL_41_10 TaxID=1802500 RepID=A0A1F7YRY0_9BACT|nr:MAG: hypothetical protein A2801_00480 [Candidatus Woesebacteria bacterium RIFCSPHIGHO2_01_FULL_41_10]